MKLTPHQRRHLTECTRQWARFMDQIDDVDAVDDSILIEITEGLQEYQRDPESFKESTEIQPRAEWLADLDQPWPMDAPTLPSP